jgi:Fungal protein of unknown function (DUF2011)
VLGSDAFKSFPSVAFAYEERDVPDTQGDSALSEDQADAGETFEFRLFSAKARLVVEGGELEGPLEARGLAQVNIRSPSPVVHGDGGFLVPLRPQSYYFIPAGDECREEGERRRKEFADVAVAGEEVMSSARSTAWVRRSPHEPE